jgi:hypothetical protein
MPQSSLLPHTTRDLRCGVPARNGIFDLHLTSCRWIWVYGSANGRIDTSKPFRKNDRMVVPESVAGKEGRQYTVGCTERTAHGAFRIARAVVDPTNRVSIRPHPLNPRTIKSTPFTRAYLDNSS